MAKQSWAETKTSWMHLLFGGNGLLWALYFMLILVSFVTVTSAVSSEVYKSISPGGGINPIVKHLLMLSVGVCMAVCVSIFSGRTLRYMLPKSYFLLMLLVRRSVLLRGRYQRS